MVPSIHCMMLLLISVQNSHYYLYFTRSCGK